VNLNMNAILDVVVDTHRAVDTKGMLSVQKLRVYQRSIEFLALVLEITGSYRRVMPSSPISSLAAAALGTMRVMRLLNETTYARGIDLLEGIVAMLTKTT
jgi:hypothetical protein